MVDSSDVVMPAYNVQVGLLPDVTPTTEMIETCLSVRTASPPVIRIQSVLATAWTRFVTASFLSIIRLLINAATTGVACGSGTH